MSQEVEKMNNQVCEHCDQADLLDPCGLCPVCRTVESIRVLYEHGRNWSPAWEQHLRRLTRRAKAGRPLFETLRTR